MVVGTRLRMITLAASTLAAVVFAAAVAGRSCGIDDDTPEGAVYSLVAAARAGDRRAVYALLGPETRERLARATGRATELVSGPTRFDELDLIGLSRNADEWRPRSIGSRTLADGRVVVVVEGPSGQRSEIPVVKYDGSWRVEIPGFLPDALPERRGDASPGGLAPAHSR